MDVPRQSPVSLWLLSEDSGRACALWPGPAQQKARRAPSPPPQGSPRGDPSVTTHWSWRLRADPKLGGCRTAGDKRNPGATVSVAATGGGSLCPHRTWSHPTAGNDGHCQRATTLPLRKQGRRPDSDGRGSGGHGDEAWAQGPRGDTHSDGPPGVRSTSPLCRRGAAESKELTQSIGSSVTPRERDPRFASGQRCRWPCS